ncbi:M3 family metallopeptidase [Sphingomonas lacunae]|uniref:M3 family metallopeptidase n=1 Tax=Sphingomonas lacunae TaxID=2698828 RepID=A0A6M4ARN8_9SPHN|nr:M3 family metallopeptidase [Sphingomonas lacunae]QJQ31693.1 M3 family metallopeptidase [Sphingomonas lacunae]
MTRRIALLMAGTALLSACTPATTSTETMASTDTSTTPAASGNPLTADWAGPYGGVPAWDKLDVEHFPAAFEEAMADYRREVAAIRDNPAPATFENTHVAMMRSGQKIRRLYSYWGVMTSNLSNPRVQQIEAEWEPRLSAFFDEISLDDKLFQRHKAVYDGRVAAGLNAQQMRIVERSFESYVRNGANLDPAGKARLTAINTELAGLFSEFGAKLLADEATYIFVTNEAELAGLEPAFKASLAAAAAAQGRPGQWAIKNTRSAAQPVLQFAENRALRERVWRAFTSRGDNGNANDTKATIARILQLRQDRAALLGFANHADYRMQDTMARTPDRAMDLMMRVWRPAVARVREEVADMQAIANREAAANRTERITIEPWDYRYYAEKVRKDRYDLNEAEVKPYLKLDNLVNGMFWAAEQLYDLRFRDTTGTISVFDPQVRTFEVTNARTGAHVGVFYLDNFAREGKRSGAWMTTYRDQQRLAPASTTIASNNNNFTPGANGAPTLISLDDASTLFHEFGHGIHYLLQDVTYPDLAGVPRDFVEYPSQVNENWLLTPEILNRFATHWQTGEPMPAALVEKIRNSDKFNQGFSTVEYLASAIVDMKLHNRSTPVTDIAAFERETLAELGMPREIVMRHRLPQFGHLFSSDAYSAGYYSYLWSETMDADTWAAFEEAGGPWDRTVADRFRTVLLSTGNETDRAEAYRVFRGRDPDVRALLAKRGFPTD